MSNPLPIQFWNPVTVQTSSGGDTESYPSASFNDFAEVKDVKDSKENDAKGLGQGKVKRFKVDYRPSLVVTQKTRIKFDGVFYTVLSIQKVEDLNFKYLIEAKAKV